VNEPLVGLAAIVALGVGGQWLAARLRLPSILILLLLGFLVGPIGGLLDPDALLGDLLFPVVSLAVAIVLFEGGLSLRLADVRGHSRIVRRLITVGALVTWLACAVAAVLLLELDVELAILFGALLIVSGPTVVAPLLEFVRPAPRVQTLLRFEGILIDPVGVVIAMSVLHALLAREAGDGLAEVLFELLDTLPIGAAVGAAVGFALLTALARHWVPEPLRTSVTLAAVLGAFALAEAAAPESGLAAATAMGIVLANQRRLPIAEIVAFGENLRTLVLGALFVVLAARLPAEDLRELVTWQCLAFLAALLLVVRPLTVAVSTIGSGVPWPERLFMAWLAPRGVVAAATASAFALQLEGISVDGVDRLAPLTFGVIVGTVAVYGLTSRLVAARLGVLDPGGAHLSTVRAEPARADAIRRAS
jgi:NhaP-type Na+/H+ or K+/H+ antiporter